MQHNRHHAGVPGPNETKRIAGGIPFSKDMIRELLGDHESLIQELRKNITDSSEKSKDAGTIDFMTGIMEDHETMAWVLRRYVN